MKIESLLTVYVFVVGLLVGSFLNVCICRFPLRETVVKGRSVCRSCGKVIAWYDNIPILSYFLLHGHCRNCSATFSVRYPIVEAVNALLWLGAYLRFGLCLHTLFLCLTMSALLVAAFIDWDTHSVPDRLSVFIGLIGIAALLTDSSITWWERLLGAVSISIPMLILACLTNGFGGADIKLSAACGLVLGWQIMLVGILFSTLPAAVWGVSQLLAKRARPRTEIAFVPFLAIGLTTSAFLAEPLIAWYLSLFA